MKSFCVVGESRSGKTLLVEHLTKRLTLKGYSVCTLKHTDRDQFDLEGKDTSRHLESGATIALGIAKNQTIAFFKQNRLEDIIPLLPPLDFLIIEGGKELSCPKILVGEEGDPKEKYIARWKISDSTDGIVQAITLLPADSVQLYVDNKRIFIKSFIQRVIVSMLLGFITNLRNIPSVEKELVIKVNLKDYLKGKGEQDLE
jgi:molybdopterin-guanine dinucleotide biosynthesis protein MobB